MKIDPKKDYYKVLDVSEKATETEIRKAYRQKAIKTHPDKNPNDAKAAEKFNAVSDAYQVLSDAHHRAQYDALRHQQAQNPGAGYSSGQGRHRSQMEDMLANALAVGVRNMFNNAARKVINVQELGLRMRQQKNGDLFGMFLPESIIEISNTKSGINFKSLNPDGTTGIWVHGQNDAFFSVQTALFLWMSRRQSLASTLFNQKSQRIFIAAVNACKDYRTQVPLMREVVSHPF